MSSQRRINASRANGQKSRGPVTPEGKQRSSVNAIRHGLLAKCVLIPGESAEAFHEVLNQFVAHFSPLDYVEFGFIEEMVASYWRMRRTMTIETTMFGAAVEQCSGTARQCLAGALSALAAN